MLCTRCKRDKHPIEFAARSDHARGRASHCKACKRAYDRARYRARRGEIRQRNKRWADAHRKLARELTAAWARANRQAYVLYSERRRAAKAMTAAPLTRDEWFVIVAEQDGRCFYCDAEAPLEVEHKTPLSRGGEHSRQNVVGACGPCNRRKHTMTADEFMEAVNA